MTVHSGPAEPGRDGPRPPQDTTPPAATPPAATPGPELPPEPATAELEPTTAEMVNRAPVQYTLEPFVMPGQEQGQVGHEQAFVVPAGGYGFPEPPQAVADAAVPPPAPFPAPGQELGYGPPVGYPMPAGYPGSFSGPPAFGPVPAQHWAPQPPYGYPQAPVPPPPTGGRRAKLLLIPAAVVVVLALVVVGLVVARGRTSGTGSAAATTHPATTASTSGTTGSAPPPSQAPSASASPVDPSRPDAALALSDQAATDLLEKDAADNRGEMQSLQGKWVPQVDGKCVGVAVDIGPNWVPDGTIETQNVTIQQILGFHIGLRNRFGAITAYQTEVGVASQTATSGACQGKVVWFSVVPQGYGSPDEANTWCSANVPPVKECEARYVARSGEKTSVKHRY